MNNNNYYIIVLHAYDLVVSLFSTAVTINILTHILSGLEDWKSHKLNNYFIINAGKPNYY